MTKLEILAFLFVIWVAAFIILFFPGRWLGAWIAKQTQSTAIGIVYCIVFAKLFVVYFAVVLVFTHLPFLPHVNLDSGFGLAFTAVMFFIPAFSALFIGFRRAQERRKSASGSLT